MSLKRARSVLRQPAVSDIARASCTWIVERVAVGAPGGDARGIAARPASSAPRSASALGFSLGAIAVARARVRSLHQDAERRAARRAGAAVPAVVRPRHLVEGGARRHARLLRDVLQHLSGRARRRSRADRQRPHARRDRASARAPRARSERAHLDLLEPADQPRIRDGGRGCGRVSGRDARPRLRDLAGRGHVRHDRRLRRHDGARHRRGDGRAPA